MHKYFLVTPVYKQSRYDFEEFTLAQFVCLLGGEAYKTVNLEWELYLLNVALGPLYIYKVGKDNRDR